MLKSMTGFGIGDGENRQYGVHVEIRAVNQRFLELGFRMPRSLHASEDMMRRCIKSHVARGKLDIMISVRDLRDGAVSVRVNRSLALAYRQALNEMSDLLHMTRSDNVSMIASYPDVLSLEEQQAASGVDEALLPALEQALSRLDSMRIREGNAIAQDFEKRLERLKAMAGDVEAMADGIVSGYRERLRKAVSEFVPEPDSQGMNETRLLQEIAIYADKVDFTEEIVRLRSHIDQFSAIQRETQEPAGRRLDFLLQEMHREANTIGSKANSAVAARIVVDMKCEIEKLREQVQNIE